MQFHQLVSGFGAASSGIVNTLNSYKFKILEHFGEDPRTLIIHIDYAGFIAAVNTAITTLQNQGKIGSDYASVAAYEPQTGSSIAEVVRRIDTLITMLSGNAPGTLPPGTIATQGWFNEHKTLLLGGGGILAGLLVVMILAKS